MVMLHSCAEFASAKCTQTAISMCSVAWCMLQGHTGKARFSNKSNTGHRNKNHSGMQHTGACRMVLQGCLVLWKCSSIPLGTALQAYCNYPLAERCLVGTRSM
jgi:hypothetical protein